MPQADEEMQQRQTYGSGRSQNARPDDVAQGAPAASPTAPSAADIAPAQDAPPSLEQVSEQAPPPTSQPEPEKRFNMPPQERWDEVIRQKEQAEQRAAQAEAMARMALERINPAQSVQQQQEPDPYAGMDPVTADWYRKIDARMEQKAEAVARQYIGQVQQSMQMRDQELTAIKVENFRKQYGIEKGSPEEASIVPYVSQGYSLEAARKLALFDRLEKENQSFRGKQASIPQRIAASNAESSSGIPSTNGLPAKQGDWRDKVESTIDKGGSFIDAVRAAF